MFCAVKAAQGCPILTVERLGGSGWEGRLSGKGAEGRGDAVKAIESEKGDGGVAKGSHDLVGMIGANLMCDSVACR